MNLVAHPVAEIFPMMSDDELQELAEDIKENGLIHPIVMGEWTTTDGEIVEGIVDGRNRYRACQIAGVEPQFTRLNGQDPRAFIVSANLERRNMTKGQQAMAMAMIYPEPEKGGRGHKRVDETSTLFSEKRLQLARAVLREAPNQAYRVLHGTEKLDAAYQNVMASQSSEKARDMQMRQLEKERPDLAEKVRQEEMTFEEARSKAKAEAAEYKQKCWAATVSLIDAVTALDRDTEFALEVSQMFDPIVEDQKGSPKITKERLQNVSNYVLALAELWDETKQ